MTSKWRVRIFREEDREGPGRDHQPRLWTIPVEADVAPWIEGAVRVLARGKWPPADLLDARKSQLDVDVPAVGLETRTFASPSVDVIDREVDLISFDLVPAGRERGQVGGTQVFERARKRSMQLRVSRGPTDVIEDHYRTTVVAPRGLRSGSSCVASPMAITWSRSIVMYRFATRWTSSGETAITFSGYRSQ